jgi:hypothetical protein
MMRSKSTPNDFGAAPSGLRLRGQPRGQPGAGETRRDDGDGSDFAGGSIIKGVTVMTILLSIDGIQAQSKMPAKTIDTTASTSLSGEKQVRTKAFVQHLERMGKEAASPAKTEDSFAVGMTVPSSIVLFALPEDAATDVPQVTSYRFFVAENGIIVIDPSTRRVVQVIR